MTKIYSVYNILCKVLIFLFPLVLFLPQQFYRNLYVSIPFWIVIGLGIFLLPAACIDIKRVWKGALFRAFVVYLVCLEIVVIFSTNIIISMPVLFLNMAYFSIFLAGGAILRSQAIKESFVATLILVVFVLSLISFYNTVIERYSNVSSEGLSFMWGYFGHNHLAVLLTMAVPLCYYFILFFKEKFYRLLLLLLFVFFVCSLFITFSRAAIFALIAASISGVVMYLGEIRRIRNKAIEIAYGVTFLTMILLAVLVMQEKKLWTGVQTRSSLYEKGVSMFMRKPLYGFGSGTFSETRIEDYIPDRGAYYPHNILIQSAAEGGFILLISTVIIYGVLFRKLFSDIRLAESARKRLFYVISGIGLGSILINEMFDFDLQLPAIGVLFWLFVSMIDNSIIQNSNLKIHRRR